MKHFVYFVFKYVFHSKKCLDKVFSSLSAEKVFCKACSKILSQMNKLHNFTFVGEFPMFKSPEDNGSLINGSRNNLQIFSQEIYLPPFDNSKAYYDLSENDADVTTYNLRFLEGYETPVNLVDEISLDAINTQEFIFLENFDEDLQNVLPDISLQDIFIDPFVMNVGKNIQEKTDTSDLLFSDNDVMNLYYWNDNPMKERKLKASRNGKDNKHKRRRNVN